MSPPIRHSCATRRGRQRFSPAVLPRANPETLNSAVGRFIVLLLGGISRRGTRDSRDHLRGHPRRVRVTVRRKAPAGKLGPLKLNAMRVKSMQLGFGQRDRQDLSLEASSRILAAAKRFDCVELIPLSLLNISLFFPDWLATTVLHKDRSGRLCGR